MSLKTFFDRDIIIEDEKVFTNNVLTFHLTTLLLSTNSNNIMRNKQIFMDYEVIFGEGTIYIYCIKRDTGDDRKLLHCIGLNETINTKFQKISETCETYPKSYFLLHDNVLKYVSSDLSKSKSWELKFNVSKHIAGVKVSNSGLSLLDMKFYIYNCSDMVMEIEDKNEIGGQRTSVNLIEDPITTTDPAYLLIKRIINANTFNKNTNNVLTPGNKNKCKTCA